MKPSSRLTLRLFIGFMGFLVCVSVSEARLRRPKLKPRPEPPYTAIASIDPAGLTLTTEPKNSTATGQKVYKLTLKTKVTVEGHEATLADLRAGMQVRIGAGMDAGIATEVSATEPPVKVKAKR